MVIYIMNGLGTFAGVVIIIGIYTLIVIKICQNAFCKKCKEEK